MNKRDKLGRFTSEGLKGLLNNKWAGDSVIIIGRTKCYA